jgi:drug/metabolite transporter (DMT)-like permease
MTGLALTLILISAFVHASWNFLAKRAGGGVPFVWLFTLCGVIIYAPLALGLLFWQHPQLPPLAWIFLFGSAAFHLAYYLLLQRGYRHGDLSIVYPLARGTGPTLSTLAAVLFLGERPTWLALVGGLLIISGVFVVTGGLQLLKRGEHIRHSVVFGLLVGLVIAGYTLWDTYSVSVLVISPLLVEYIPSFIRFLMLTPIALRYWPEVKEEWHRHRREAIGIGILSPLAYILVLTALTFTPVSYVAPAREMSVLIAVFMGTGLLKEGQARRRFVAASLIATGIIALAIS